MKNLLPKSVNDLIDQLPGWLMLGLLILSPLAVFPFGDNLFKHSKNLMLFAGTLLIFLLFALFVYKKNVSRLIISPFFLPLSLFFLASIFSSLLAGTNYPVESLVGWGGVYLSFALFVLLGSSLLKPKLAQGFSLGLTFVAAVVSVLSILEYAGTGPSQVFSELLGIPLANPQSFNVTGSIFVAGQVMFLGLLVSLTNLLKTKKMRLWYFFTVPVLAVGLALAAWQSMPGKETAVRFTPFQVSWVIAVNTLNLPKTALIGFGPESYSEVYSLLKPAGINTTDLWNIQFSQASSTPLTIMTTMGLLGLAAWILLGAQALRQIKTTKDKNKPLLVVVLASLILQLIFPTNTLMLIVLAVALSIWISETQDDHASIELHPLQVRMKKAGEKQEKISEYSRGFGYFLSAMIILIVAGLSYGLFRVYASYGYLFLAEKGALQNNAITVYNNQQKAIAYNPYIDSLRRNYAVTNLQIASVLSQKESPTQEDAQQVTTLIQQAIREGRAATLINANDSTNWRVLGNIYRQLIGSADGAENWSVSAYSRSIELSPADPTLRIDLGGVFFSQEEYQQAATLFEQATILKPDYANAHYNLANALRMAENYQLAATAYQQTIALLDPSSPDYTQAQSELQEVQAKLQTQQGQAQPTQQQEVNLIEENLPQEQPTVEPEANTQVNEADIQATEEITPVEGN